MLDWNDWPRCRYEPQTFLGFDEIIRQRDFRARLLAEAREWEGTPFVWQQSVKQVGCDCKGLVLGIARGAGCPESEAAQVLLNGDHHGRVPKAELRHTLASLFDKVEIAQPADILLIKVGGKAQHLGMYMGDGKMIHCYQRGPSRAIIVPMGHAWWSMVDSVWSWRR